MNKKRYFALAAAALLAVAPIATTSFVSSPMIVKADSGEPDVNAVKLVLGSKKKYLTLSPNGNYTDYTRDITTNHGKVKLIFDTYYYKKNKNGKVDYSTPINSWDLKNGDEGVLVATVYVDKLKANTDYTYLTKTDDSGNLVWTTTNTENGVEHGLAINASPAVKIPFVVGHKRSATSSSTTKVNARGYVTVRKGHKVRTYTSTGKFSKHYVYGHKTYKLNQKKNIKGHGICYKIYGKNQWIPSKYLKF